MKTVYKLNQKDIEDAVTRWVQQEKGILEIVKCELAIIPESQEGPYYSPVSVVATVEVEGD